MMRYFFLLFCFSISRFCAQNFPSKPLNYVSDIAGILSQQQEDELNRKLRAYEKSTTNQFFVLIMDSLGDGDMASYCQNVFATWHIGAKGRNNGALVALFMKDHKFRIHTGYGLEGALPDIRTNSIQDNTMRPAFKNGNYYEGLSIGLDELINYSQNEFTASSPKPNKTWPWWIYAYIVNCLLLVILVLLLIFKPQPDKKRRNELLGWGIFVWLFPVLGSLVTLGLVSAAWRTDYKKNNQPLKRNRRAKRRDKKEQKEKSSPIDYSGGSYNDSSGSFDSYDSGSSSSDFDGGGGGDSGGGGSDSDW